MLDDLSSLGTTISTLIVAISIALLVRQNRIAQLQATRTLQLELVRLGIEHPEMRVRTSQYANPEQEQRVNQMRNLWLMHHQMNFLIGSATESEVRAVIRDDIFSSQAGYDWWSPARSSRWHESAGRSRKLRRFVNLVDEQHYLAGQHLIGTG